MPKYWGFFSIEKVSFYTKNSNFFDSNSKSKGNKRPRFKQLHTGGFYYKQYGKVLL